MSLREYDNKWCARTGRWSSQQVQYSTTRSAMNFFPHRACTVFSHYFGNCVQHLGLTPWKKDAGSRLKWEKSLISSTNWHEPQSLKNPLRALRTASHMMHCLAYVVAHMWNLLPNEIIFQLKNVLGNGRNSDFMLFYEFNSYSARHLFCLLYRVQYFFLRSLSCSSALCSLKQRWYHLKTPFFSL